MTAWMGAFGAGQLLVISDESDGLQYVYQTTGTPTLHSGYYAIPIVYVSGSSIQINYSIVYSSPSGSLVQGETVTGLTSGATGVLYANNGVNIMTVHGITGTFSAGETIRGNTSHATVVFTSIGGDTLNIAYLGGQNLADMLFQNYCSLVANYRRAIRGNILSNGGIGMYKSILDEDGTLYAQTSNKIDFKKGTMVIDLEETSATPANINKTNQSSTNLSQQKLTISLPPPPPSNGGTKTQVSLSKTVALNANKPINYPTR